MPAYIYLIILVGIVVWFYPFVGAHKLTPPAVTVNRRSRWGMLLQFIAFTVLWQEKFWLRSPAKWQVGTCVLFFVLAALLSRTSSRALAGQLRVDAALGAEHKLVKSGPYAIVRNPIYTSMLLMQCAIAVVITEWKLFAVALVLFLIGTEIRVRTEEALLATKFGEEFENYRKNVGAYVPFM